MSVYGLDYRTGVARTGFVNATGWSPTLGPNTTGPATIASATPAVQTNGVTAADDRLSKAFRRSGPTAEAIRQLVANLLAGNASVGNATYLQVKGQATDDNRGGLRPLDTITQLADRAYTAADKAALAAIFLRSNKPTTYVTDPSRNGGGGKSAW